MPDADYVVVNQEMVRDTLRIDEYSVSAVQIHKNRRIAIAY
jgi:hypothetical protein